MFIIYMKRIIVLLTISVYVINISIAHWLTANELDYNEVKPRVNSVQNINPDLPGISEQKWTIGTIVSKVFTSTWKIKNIFIKAFGDRTDTAVLRWTGWNNGQLVQWSIFDNGTNVAIGWAPSVYKLNVTGDINFTGNLRKNGVLVDFAWKFVDGTNINNAVYTSWSVGIGKQPTQALDVNGNILSSGFMWSRYIQFQNLEPTNLTNDWDVWFDASRWIIINRAQQVGQETGVGTYTVLDTSNITGWTGINISNTAQGTAWTEAITFSANNIPWSSILDNTITENDIDNAFIARNSQLLDGFDSSEWSAWNTIAKRNSSWDINARLFRSEFGDQTWVSQASSIAFRNNNSTDNYIRFVDRNWLLNYIWKTNDSNLLDGINSSSFLRSDVNDTLNGWITPASTDKRTAWMYGIYDSTRIWHIWSMGNWYRIADNGSTFWNLYGLAYKHTNNPTGWNMAGGHQMVWTQNGVPNSAIGTNIWTSGQFIWNGASITNINGDNIQDGTIDGSEIQDNTLTAADIASNSITGNELNNTSAFTTWQITNNWKLFLNQSSSYDLWIEWNGTTWTNPRNLAILWHKGNDSLYINYGWEYSGGTILGWNVSISWWSMSGDNITDNTIDSSEIENYTLTSTDIAANSITAGRIAANSINGSELNTSWNFTMASLNVTWTLKAKFACRRVISGETFTNWAEATCAANEFVMSWGGSCKIAADDYIETSIPLSWLWGWTVNCRTRQWNNAAQTAYAICCDKS